MNYNDITLYSWVATRRTPEQELKHLQDQAAQARERLLEFAKKNDFPLSETERIVIIGNSAFSCEPRLADAIENLMKSRDDYSNRRVELAKELDRLKDMIEDAENARVNLLDAAKRPERDY